MCSFRAGAVAGDEECYTTFAALFDPMLKELFGYGPEGRQRIDCDTTGIVWPTTPKLDPDAVSYLQVTVRCGDDGDDDDHDD
jgi:hypothetical protein